MPPRPVVAVVGPGDADVPPELLELAREAGRLLAQNGFAVVTGGLGGVMAAAALGARREGGLVIGLLPGGDRADAGEHLSPLDVALPTGLGQARNALVVAAADALLAVGGSWGTLSEIALARRTGTPVVCLRGWQVLDAAGAPVALDVAASPADAVAAIARALRSDG
ncbi:MAG TPA: dethiobiotin synthetase [Jatrophihabitans sp.]|nr:dethiobiotin synthetase [Jatrophihabitans sp.]